MTSTIPTLEQLAEWWRLHKQVCAICQHSRGSIVNVCDVTYDVLWQRKEQEKNAPV